MAEGVREPSPGVDLDQHLGQVDLWEQVPPEFWRHHQVDYESFLEADPKLLHALPCSRNGALPAIGELMTSRASVDAFCEAVAL